MLLYLLLGFILVSIAYLSATSYLRSSGSDISINIILAIFGFICFVYVGLYITDGITNTYIYLFTWIVYTILAGTILNILAVSHFWSVIRKKTGPTGVRGIMGLQGPNGPDGRCPIEAANVACIKTLNEHIDSIYQELSGAPSIYNPDQLKFTNNYLTDKVRSLCSSQQFNTLSEYMNTNNRPLNDLFQYLKSIWTVWISEIFKVGGDAWFMESTADEADFNTDKNPFNEIKKYDVYHWGLTDLFRPIKAEICRTTDQLISNKIPYHDEARLKIITSNDYRWVWNDNMTNAGPDSTVWMAKPITLENQRYYPIGQTLTSGNYRDDSKSFKKGPTFISDIEQDLQTINGPDFKTILVAGDIKIPIGYQEVWNDDQKKLRFDRRSSGTYSGILYKPVCPSGYQSMGEVMKSYNGVPNITSENDKVACVPKDCVEEIKADEVNRWKADEKRKKLRQGVELNVIKNTYGSFEPKPDNGYNIYRARNARPDTLTGSNYKYKGEKFYRIKSECLREGKAMTKEIEPETAELGIGWHGHPYKGQDKYSIFTFLGLVPEGIIVHQVSGRRFYVVHSGSIEVNNYIIQVFNDDENNYSNALEVQSGPDNIITAEISRSDIRQQWKIIIKSDDTKLMYLESLYRPNHYLKITLEPRTGRAQFKLVKSSKGELDKYTLFAFISATGTQLNSLNKGVSGKKTAMDGTQTFDYMDDNKNESKKYIDEKVDTKVYAESKRKPNGLYGPV